METIDIPVLGLSRRLLQQNDNITTDNPAIRPDGFTFGLGLVIFLAVLSCCVVTLCNCVRITSALLTQAQGSSRRAGRPAASTIRDVRVKSQDWDPNDVDHPVIVVMPDNSVNMAFMPKAPPLSPKPKRNPFSCVPFARSTPLPTHPPPTQHGSRAIETRTTRRGRGRAARSSRSQNPQASAAGINALSLRTGARARRLRHRSMPARLHAVREEAPAEDVSDDSPSGVIARRQSMEAAHNRALEERLPELLSGRRSRTGALPMYRISLDPDVLDRSLHDSTLSYSPTSEASRTHWSAVNYLLHVDDDSNDDSDAPDSTISSSPPRLNSIDSEPWCSARSMAVPQELTDLTTCTHVDEMGALPPLDTSTHAQPDLEGSSSLNLFIHPSYLNQPHESDTNASATHSTASDDFHMLPMLVVRQMTSDLSPNSHLGESSHGDGAHGLSDHDHDPDETPTLASSRQRR